MKKTIMLFILAISSLFILAMPLATAHAATSPPPDCSVLGAKKFLGLPAWYKYLHFEADSSGNCTVSMNEEVVDANGNILTTFSFKVIYLIAFAVMEILLTIAGIVAFAFVFIGGFLFVTSQGSSDAIAKGRKTLANALVGVVIAVVASRTVAFIAGRLKGENTTSDGYGLGLITATADQAALVRIANYALTLLGAVSVLVIVISGIQFITSGGNSDKVAKARNAIYFALIGLIVAILAAAIINYVISKATA